MKFACFALLALAACSSAVETPGPATVPVLTPPYARDRCGEDITPTHPATPDNVVCN